MWCISGSFLTRARLYWEKKSFNYWTTIVWYFFILNILFFYWFWLPQVSYKVYQSSLSLRLLSCMFKHVCGVFCLKYLPFINTLTTVFLSLFGHVISLMGDTKWMGPCIDNLIFLFNMNVFKVPIAVSWRGEVRTEKQVHHNKICLMPLTFLSSHLLRMSSMNWHCHWPMSLPVQK